MNGETSRKGKRGSMQRCARAVAPAHIRQQRRRAEGQRLPLMAPLRHHEVIRLCLLTRVKRSRDGHRRRTEFDPPRSLSRLIFGRTWLPLLCYLPAARETVVLPISTSHSQGSMMKRLRSRIGPDRSSTRESAMSRSHLIAMLVAVAIGVAPAQAQDQFPTKPIRIVLPVPAGSALDVATRAIADELTARWGQQVLVEARPGAGGLIAGQAVATAAPDGYTLVGGPASLFTILPAQKDKLPIDVNKDFAHIGMIVGSAVLFIAASNRELKAQSHCHLVGALGSGSCHSFGVAVLPITCESFTCRVENPC